MKKGVLFSLILLASGAAGAQQCVVDGKPIALDRCVPGDRSLWFGARILIADQSGRHYSVAGTDSLLRRSLPYTGFHEVAAGAMRYPNSREFTVRIEGDKYRLLIDPHDAPGSTDTTRVRTGVVLARAPWSDLPTPTETMERVISSPDLSLPVGQMIVLGSGSLGGGRAVVVIVQSSWRADQHWLKKD